MTNKSKLSTESYKGVRDFYPEDLFVQKHIFNVWKKTVESFGYIEYTASVLEPAELYRAKTGEEIVNDQTYTFTDRGEREVTLRPEMTPTVARLVAAKEKELTFPLRWYSVPNLFRYEKPQRGRLREHWQLNVDIFGVESNDAETEIISIAHAIMKNFGAKETDFVIKVNSRKVMNALYAKFEMNDEQIHKVSKLIDRKNKISGEVFDNTLSEIIGGKSVEFSKLLGRDEKLLEYVGADSEPVKNLVGVIEQLGLNGITNIEFDPTLMRGFDYYTGVVFEVFDLHPDNNRALFGGGRYDDLLDIFGARKIPAFGFGKGDVTARDFLDVHGLLPKYKPATDIYVCTLKNDFKKNAQELAKTLRESGLNVAVDLSSKKIGDQIKAASKQSVPYVVCIGDDEVSSGLYSVKNLDTGIEKKLKASEIFDEVRG